MNWLILVAAGLFEVAWAIGLKYTEGFTRLLPTIGTVIARRYSRRDILRGSLDVTAATGFSARRR